MRVIFALLVLLNVAYLAYQHVFPESLASQIDGQAADSEATTSDRSSDEARTSEGAAKPGSNAGLNTGAATAAAKLVPSAPRSNAALASAAPRTDPATDPATDPGAGGAANNDAKPEQQARTGAPRPADPGCTVIGPFASESIVKSLITQLAAGGIEATVDSFETGSLPDYLVHVGPAANRAEAKQLLQRFEDRDVESYLIDKGSFENAISLGVFTREPFALALQDKHRKAGFDVKISQIPRRRRGYSLRADLTRAMYQELLREQNPLRDCDSASSA